MVDHNHDIILDLFNHRCIRCGKKTNVVHEMLPRSLGKESMEIENRVPLCGKCHEWAHEIGTKESREILTQLRKKKLKVCQKT